MRMKISVMAFPRRISPIEKAADIIRKQLLRVMVPAIIHQQLNRDIRLADDKLMMAFTVSCGWRAFARYSPP